MSFSNKESPEHVLIARRMPSRLSHPLVQLQQNMENAIFPLCDSHDWNVSQPSGPLSVRSNNLVKACLIPVSTNLSIRIALFFASRKYQNRVASQRKLFFLGQLKQTRIEVAVSRRSKESKIHSWGCEHRVCFRGSASKCMFSETSGRHGSGSTEVAGQRAARNLKVVFDCVSRLWR